METQMEMELDRRLKRVLTVPMRNGNADGDGAG